jgi:peptidoglycan-associated lipoprotein
MTRHHHVTRLTVAVIVLSILAACAPGRAVHRGNWPDGRIDTSGARFSRPAPVPVAPAEEEWQPADPMPALSAADLNRMGVLQTVHFDFDQAALASTEQQNVLRANAIWLADNPTARIIVEGHCDERGTRRYNLALGQRRAEAARDALVAMGVAPERIEVVSYGEELPAEARSNEAAWAANRRAEFIIVAVE